MNETERKAYIDGLRAKHARHIQQLEKSLVRAQQRERRLLYDLRRARRRVPVPELLPGLVAHRRCPPSPDDHRDRLVPTDVQVTIDHLHVWLPAKFADKVRWPWAQLQQVRSAVVGGIMVDIGANIGQTSIPRAVLGDFQAIYAAEPSPQNYARLVATIAANGVQGLVMPDRVAIGNQNKTVHFGTGHYRGQTVASPTDTNTILVTMCTLDTWVERLGINPAAITFVKTDTNGTEVDVLCGAAQILARRQAVWQIEVAPTAMTALGSSLGSLIAMLTPHFSHFIDLSLKAPGEVLRPIAELAEALAYLETLATTRGGKPPQTDLLCINC